jgi:type II restriction enzyme
VKLGRWQDYLAMRSGILRLNDEYRNLLSNDLGAIGGLLFDIGSGRYAAPPAITADAESQMRWEADLAKVREEGARAKKALDKAREGDRTHTEIQGWLRDLGLALGFDVWVASNDRSREYNGGALSDRCLSDLPDDLKILPSADTIGLIDVLWLEVKTGSVAAAFEVEHTSSVYSGILRLFDLSLSQPGKSLRGMYLVAPDDREEEVRSQLSRPAFRTIGSLSARYLPYSELENHRESMARFGEGLKAIEAVARSLV